MEKRILFQKAYLILVNIETIKYMERELILLKISIDIFGKDTIFFL